MRFRFITITLFALLIGARQGSWFSRGTVAVVWGFCAINLLAGGPWGQNLRITRELHDARR